MNSNLLMIAIFAAMAILPAVVTIQEVSAAPGQPGESNGNPSPNSNAIDHACANGYPHTPANQPPFC